MPDSPSLLRRARCLSGWPEVRQGQVPQSKVSIDNVNRLLMPKIREALKIRAYITISFIGSTCRAT